MKTVGSVLIVLLIAVAGFYFLGTPSPTVTLVPDKGTASAMRQFTATVSTTRSTLKDLTVSVSQESRTAGIIAKTYGAGVREAKETFTLAEAGLKDGAFTLQVKATNIPTFGAGRTTTQARSFTYDNTPPIVSVLSTAHNISRGGAGLVAYTISKEVEKTGVVFGNRFYPGYRQHGNFYACLFPYPYNIDAATYVPKVIAVDRSGNERLVTINYHLLPKSFPSDRIILSDTFLDKIAAEFRNRFPQAATPLDIFLKANNDLRQQDAKALVETGKKTSPVPLWKGDFLRLPNSAPRGSFAQARTYVYNGKEVDHQTHLGVDLASLAHSPVPAANSGTVVFAADLGIYGLCIIIDHGLGLQSLYGHLSQISVKVGDSVEKGTIIGNTGATGMAGGDHLHFGILASGEEINPIEWWDPSWIRNNITGKLELGKPADQK